MGHTAYARFESSAICTATCSSALSIKHAIICLIRRKWRWQRCQLRRHRGSNGAWLILIACRVGFNLTVQCGAVQLVVVASDSQLQLQQPHPNDRTAMLMPYSCCKVAVATENAIKKYRITDTHAPDTCLPIARIVSYRIAFDCTPIDLWMPLPFTTIIQLIAKMS